MRHHVKHDTQHPNSLFNKTSACDSHNINYEMISIMVMVNYYTLIIVPIAPKNIFCVRLFS